MRYAIVGLLVSGLWLALANPMAWADDFAVDWWTVDGGGGMASSGGNFTLAGTIGQPDAGVMTGGNFTLSGGFWAGGVAGPVVCPGDCDCDGRVAFSDIDFFVAAIPDNEAAWRALYVARHGGELPPCPFANNDTNGDGHVNFADIDPFVALIPSLCP